MEMTADGGVVSSFAMLLLVFHCCVMYQYWRSPGVGAITGVCFLASWSNFSSMALTTVLDFGSSRDHVG